MRNMVEDDLGTLAELGSDICGGTKVAASTMAVVVSTATGVIVQLQSFHGLNEPRRMPRRSRIAS
jgi:hypothetical protein